MNLAYVCMSWILYEILYYTWVLCMCTYVRNSIFRMVLSTWLHTHFCMKVLIMYLRFPIFKLLPSNFPKLYLLHFMMSSQNKLLSQQLCKATSFTYDLELIWNFGETWTTMSTTIFQNFSSFNFMKWEILLLPWNHLKLGPKHKMTYNSLSTTPNSLKFWETH